MRTCLVLLAVLSFSGVAAAQSGPCTEEGVKAIIASKAVQRTGDSYFFSGALDKPVIGTSATGRAEAPVRASRKNESEKSTTDRIVADDSGGMAYEYGTTHITYDDAKTGKHEDFTSAYLVVWKADGGACKVAAEMAEPENGHQRPPAAAKQ